MFYSRSFLLPAFLGLAIFETCTRHADAQKGGGSSGGRSSPAPSAGRSTPAPNAGRSTPAPSGSSSSSGKIPHSNPSMHHSSPPVHRNQSHYRYPLYYGYSYSLPYSYVDPLYDYSYYPPLYERRLYYPEAIPAEPVNQPAYIEVRLPTADAQILLDGNKTTSTGTQRVYTSSALAPGDYSYELTATWKQDGQDVRIVRTIRVAPGRTTLVDFTK